ncbi:hypothetical protein COLO4_16949 [Corchorus olitorius]|uniref:Uncharacterized protein n=1 Tax=Corchorus olitorius TaxID=93759 RepID=A0A1R3JEV9_9ROSI|nr:hypothetical protein COLO4_16949 [Corchorus olitorius]
MAKENYIYALGLHPPSVVPDRADRRLFSTLYSSASQLNWEEGPFM